MVFESNISPSASDLVRCLHSVSEKEGVASLLVLACDENGYTPADLDPALLACSIPIAGGIFPQLLLGRERMETGFIVVGLESPLQVTTIGGLSDPSTDFEAELEALEVGLGNTRTVMVFVDGLSRRISALVEELFAVFGLETNYIGGGAGSLSFEKRPCLFSNAGLLQDSAVLAFAEFDSSIGVSHGWQVLDGPFEVTEAHSNAVASLDWQPAYDVYREVVEDHIGPVFAGSEFFEIAKSYPFGISKLGAEKIVRDPIALGGANEIICVGEVPNQAFVHILSGEPDSLIAAAGEALRKSVEGFKGESGSRAILLIDCISRFLFLGEDFDRELEAVSIDEDTPTFGALTLGEIANNKKDYLEFYNKTVVVGTLEI